VAAEALGLMKDYYFRIATTRRHYIREDIQAPSLEAAIAKARAIDIHDTYWDNSDDIGGIEGDEMIYIDDENYDALAEIDMRGPGEPFSWAACDFVKELAKDDAFKSERDAVIALRMWVGRAKELCSNPVNPVRYEHDQE